MKKVFLIITFLIFTFPTNSSAATYGDNVIISGTVSCKDEYGGIYLCSKSVDGLDEWPAWHTKVDTNPWWWHYDLGEGITKEISRFSINGRNDGTGYGLKDFNVYGSNDDTNWDLLGGFTAENIGSGYQNFDFSNFTAYRYYKLDDMSLPYSDFHALGIIEIKAMECTDCVAPGLSDFGKGILAGLSVRKTSFDFTFLGLAIIMLLSVFLFKRKEV